MSSDARMVEGEPVREGTLTLIATDGAQIGEAKPLSFVTLPPESAGRNLRLIFWGERKITWHIPEGSFLRRTRYLGVVAEAQLRDGEALVASFGIGRHVYAGDTLVLSMPEDAEESVFPREGLPE